MLALQRGHLLDTSGVTVIGARAGMVATGPQLAFSAHLRLDTLLLHGPDRFPVDALIDGPDSESVASDKMTAGVILPVDIHHQFMSAEVAHGCIGISLPDIIADLLIEGDQTEYPVSLIPLHIQIPGLRHLVRKPCESLLRPFDAVAVRRHEAHRVDAHVVEHLKRGGKLIRLVRMDGHHDDRLGKSTKPHLQFLIHHFFRRVASAVHTDRILRHAIVGQRQKDLAFLGKSDEVCIQQRAVRRDLEDDFRMWDLADTGPRVSNQILDLFPCQERFPTVEGYLCAGASPVPDSSSSDARRIPSSDARRIPSIIRSMAFTAVSLGIYTSSCFCRQYRQSKLHWWVITSVILFV